LLDHAAAISFVQRIGFRRTWSDERFVYFALTELPFPR
jgi:hypothetical protein